MARLAIAAGRGSGSGCNMVMMMMMMMPRKQRSVQVWVATFLCGLCAGVAQDFENPIIEAAEQLQRSKLGRRQ